jgi:DNA-binding MarR family transcriptional regulator
MIDDSAHRPAAGELPGVLAERMTYLLRRVTDAAGRKANVALAPLQIDTRHYTVLAVIGAGGGSSQRTIADTLRLDRATVVALVDTLESLGLAKRVRSREDRRANAVEITARGRHALGRANELMAACELEFVAALQPAERQSLGELLERLLKANRHD